MATVVAAQTPLGTAFTYQGQLTTTGSPANGSFDFQFILYTAPIGGSQVGPIVNLNGVAVNGGRFTVSLDFGAGAFPGEARWLDIALRPAGTGSYTILTPRQPLTPAPYALTAAQVMDAAIVDADISAAAAISGAKLADESVSADKIVDGPASGLDSDLFDNLNSTQFLRSDVSGTLTGELTVHSHSGTNAVLSELGIDRASSGFEPFTIQNSGSGVTQLKVEGSPTPFTPAYSFSTDPDTGLFSPAANTVALASGGQQVVTVDAGGLDAVTAIIGGIGLTGTSTVNGDGVFGTASTGRGVVARNTSNGPALVASSASGDHLRASANPSSDDVNPVLRITSAGHLMADGAIRVGASTDIGTPAPTFSSFGNGTKDEATIDSVGDVYVSADLEVDNDIFVASDVIAGTSLRVGTTILDTDSLDVADGFRINVAGNPADLVFAGTNAIVQIGDTGADKVGIGRVPVTNAFEVNGNASKTTAGDWLANSDRRLKTDVEGLKDALGVVRRLRPVRFRYSEEYRRKNPSVKDVYYHNYVAQEFQQVFADSVQDDGEGFLQMDAHPASIYAVGAIQELDRLLAEKDAKIATLERRLALLEDAFTKRVAAPEKSPAADGAAGRGEEPSDGNGAGRTR